MAPYPRAAAPMAPPPSAPAHPPPPSQRPSRRACKPPRRRLCRRRPPRRLRQDEAAPVRTRHRASASRVASAAQRRRSSNNSHAHCASSARRAWRASLASLIVWPAPSRPRTGFGSVASAQPAAYGFRRHTAAGECDCDQRASAAVRQRRRCQCAATRASLCAHENCARRRRQEWTAEASRWRSATAAAAFCCAVRGGLGRIGLGESSNGYAAAGSGSPPAGQAAGRPAGVGTISNAFVEPPRQRRGRVGQGASS